jgi:hypothetical protein
MTPPHEDAHTDMTLPPRSFRERSNSMRIPLSAAQVPNRRPYLRSISYSNHYTPAFEREHHCSRVNIAYRDDTLPARSLTNIYQLLRAVQRTDESDAAQREDDRDSTATATANSNSVELAKKVLRYRGLLRRAEEVSLDDPAFDINEFLRVTWSRVDGS